MADIYQQYSDFKNFEILFKDKEGELQKVTCKVYAIESSYIVVSSNLEKNAFVEVPEGAKVKIYVYTENGVYSSDSDVLIVEKKVNHVLYTLTYPQNSKHSQRREFFRAEMPVPIKVTVVTDLLNQTSYDFKTRSKNICGNGICFMSEVQIKNYEQIIISMNFAEKDIEVTAKLIYSKSRFVKGREYFTNALTFTDISDKDTDFIVKKCFLFQLRCKNME